MKQIGEVSKELVNASENTQIPPEGMPLSEIISLVEVFLGQWPDARADNPDVYAGAIASVLFDYPPDVIMRAVDPRNGLASVHKYVPKLSEVKTFCENEMSSRRRIEALDARRRETLAKLPAPSQPRKDRPTFEELKSKYGPNWGLGALPRESQSRPDPGTPSKAGTEAASRAEKGTSQPGSEEEDDAPW